MYYGTPFDDDDGIHKAMCSSWGEAKLFADPRVMKIDMPGAGSHNQTKIFDHHRKALYKVQASRSKRLMCKEYAQSLSKCLRKKGMSKDS